MAEYAVYKGESLICIGTLEECADHMKVKLETVKFYLTPTYERRIAKRKNARNYITVTKLEDENDVQTQESQARTVDAGKGQSVSAGEICRSVSGVLCQGGDLR